MSTASTHRTTGRVLGFTGFRRTVADLDRSIDFYVQGLGFSIDPELDRRKASAASPAATSARGACLTLGQQALELASTPAPRSQTSPQDPDSSVSSAAFQHIAIVTNDMDAAVRRLARHAPEAISVDGAVRLPASSGGVTAFKFRDPDGRALELICFPPGTGHPEWQRAAATGPTIGIDHSAIGVLDIDKSLAFYVDVLGFRVASRQTNRGAEQARLDGTAEAVVEVVGLAPAAEKTPHVELLGYRVPVPTRRSAMPALAEDPADRMTLVADDLAALVARLDALPERLATERMTLGPHVLLIRDPYGHALLLQQTGHPSF